jgi:hypothetical protein
MLLLRIFVITIVVAPFLGAANKPAASQHKETVRGYLVDLVCMKEEAGKVTDFAPNHSKKCLQMPACMQGGYGILLPTKEVLSFDDQSNELARKLIAARHQEKGFVIKATGARQGDRFHVIRFE